MKRSQQFGYMNNAFNNPFIFVPLKLGFCIRYKNIQLSEKLKFQGKYLLCINFDA